MACERDPLVPAAAEPLKTVTLAVAAFASLSGLLLGYDIGITNGALVPLARHFGLDHREMELLVGILNGMALPGTMAGSYIAERLGRRRGMTVGAIVFLVGNALMTFAHTYALFVIGRGIAGVAVGMTLVLGPLYTAETSPARLRGLLSANVEVSLNVGILLGYIFGWALSGLADDVSWRWMIGISLLAPILSLAGVLFVLPESPRWLASVDRLDEAEEALHMLLGPLEAEADAKRLRLGRAQGASPSASPGSASHVESEMAWSEMLANRHIRWLMIVGGGVSFFGQATGVETITYYSSLILLESGMSRQETLTSTIWVGVVKVVAIITSGLYVDRIGRVPLLIGSSLGMAVSMALTGTAALLGWSPWTQVVPMVTFVASFSLGYGPIVYTLNSEIYPRHCRSKGLAFAMGIGRITAAVVASSFLTLVDFLTSAGAFFVFAAISLAAAVFIAAIVPETKGSRLEDQDELFASKAAVDAKGV